MYLTVFTEFTLHITVPILKMLIFFCLLATQVSVPSAKKYL